MSARNADPWARKTAMDSEEGPSQAIQTRTRDWERGLAENGNGERGDDYADGE